MTPVSYRVQVTLRQGLVRDRIPFRHAGQQVTETDAQRLAATLVGARREALPLRVFPAEIPTTLEAAYRVQEAGIALWPDTLAGWKIGLIQPPHRERYNEERLAGPIFAADLRHASGADIVACPIFTGGFGAIEAEFVVRLGADAPTTPANLDENEAAALVDALHIGVEIASSPFAGINDLGPAVTVADFGNNAGLVLGPAIQGWRAIPFAAMRATAEIDGAIVGEGTAASIPGGPITALSFLIDHCAARGRPLKAGQYVTTGATTGVHNIAIGQVARCDFGVLGAINVQTIAATPRVAEKREAAR